MEMDFRPGEPLEVYGPPSERPPTAFELYLLDACRRFFGASDSRVQVAPTIPPVVIGRAAQRYLRLREAEEPLIVLGMGRAGREDPLASCVLTNRGVHFFDTSARGGRPAGPLMVEYGALPRSIGRTGVAAPVVDLGECGLIGLGGRRGLQERLVAFLEEAGAMARGERPLPMAAFDEGAAEWSAVISSGRAAKETQGQLIDFVRRTSTRPVVVTPMLVIACIAMFVPEVYASGSLGDPSVNVLLALGASNGMRVALHHEAWRLVSCMFLHGGLVHLLMNVWCLMSVGPVVERFFGRAAFAALYLIAGLGGSIASLWYHPVVTSVGASGAVFGLFGGLLGFLAVRRKEVPVSVLQPMRSGAIAFIGYNVLFGMAIPGIDNAAHLGGLATGFLTGLLLTLAAPDRAGALTRAVARVAVVVALGLGLFGLERTACRRALNDPGVGWNAFIAPAQPIMDELDRNSERVQKFVAALEAEKHPQDSAISTLDGLTRECASIGARLAALPALNPEIVAIQAALSSAENHRRLALNALRGYLTTNKEAFLDGPGGWHEEMNASEAALKQFTALSKAYLERHALRTRGR
jgi:rhomboid protease GluP